MVCAYNLYRVYKFTNNVEKAVGIGMCMCFHLVKYNLVFIIFFFLTFVMS